MLTLPARLILTRKPCSVVVGLFEAEYRNRLGCGLLATGIWSRTAEQTVKSEADLRWTLWTLWTLQPLDFVPIPRYATRTRGAQRGPS